MPRKRKPLSDEEKNRRRKKDRSYQAKERYAQRQRELFFIEYEKLCKKYGCFVQCLYGAHVTKQRREEKIYTMQSHLESLKRDLQE